VRRRGLPRRRTCGREDLPQAQQIAIGAAQASSTVNVNAMTGRVKRVEVALNKVSRTRGQDLDVLLVSPAGDAVVVASDACNEAVTNRYRTFAMDAAPILGGEPGACGGFSYKPGDHGYRAVLRPTRRFAASASPRITACIWSARFCPIFCVSGVDPVGVVGQAAGIDWSS
jgi:hypothetical protein